MIVRNGKGRRDKGSLCVWLSSWFDSINVDILTNGSMDHMFTGESVRNLHVLCWSNKGNLGKK